MAHETTSKNMDGITDLVVVAPIREDFIAAYENVTYATRLRIVAEALNRVRVTAREHEVVTPFSDVTERILTLLDFRIGVVDKDLFGLAPAKTAFNDRVTPPQATGDEGLRSRRFLYLTATFDGAWEPYMRLIWDPLGPFLDLLFCNCEGYVTAAEHSFDEFAQWVRDNQMDSAIFYTTTGLTIRDHIYLKRLEQLQRAYPPGKADREIARMTMPKPELAAKAERDKALRDYQNGDPELFRKEHELALEALTVLYRLADYYPPEWMAPGVGASEGHYLVRAAESILSGWEEITPKPPYPQDWQAIEKVYAQPLEWYRTGVKHLRKLDAQHEASQPPDPEFKLSQIQGGMLKPQGSIASPMRQGALLLMTVRDPDAARKFIKHLEIHYADGPGATPKDGFYRTVALTVDGLRRLGVATGVTDWFPKEFREGMEMRSGLIGDMRENHPRNWTLPQRNWPPLPEGADPYAKARPPIETSEIDIVVQIRTALADRKALLDEIAALARTAGPGLALLGYELMHSDYQANGSLIDYFGFRDGISQPRPTENLAGTPKRDEVRLGELLLGYRNDRSDFAPIPSPPPANPHDPTPEEWRLRERNKSLKLQKNGSFLVIRKLEQHVETFEAFIAAQTIRINQDHPKLRTPMTPERLKARILGRYPDGRPLIPTNDPKLNDFDYLGDAEGVACPFAAHIRRTNPRDSFQGRSAPRLIRRGMSFDRRDAAGKGPRGLMFMAYNASIAEQFETVQRWINGGNSTYVASGQNDPMLGVAPKTGALVKAERVFRFIEEGAVEPDGSEKDEVIRVTMPEPFVGLHWGLYLFVPSRHALAHLCKLKGGYRPIREALQRQGAAVIDRLTRIGNNHEEAREWKRLLEDFDAKDPSERDISPDMWAAIRWCKGGSYKIPEGVAFIEDWNTAPDITKQPVILSASYTHIMRVLSDWKHFTTEEQLRRITLRHPDKVDSNGVPIPPDDTEPGGIPIFVTQQPSRGPKPNNDYKATALRGRYNYERESTATNDILMQYKEKDGFEAGYLAGTTVLAKAKRIAAGQQMDYFEMELRREYLLLALQGLCTIWYGVPDGENFFPGGWTWQAPEDRNPPGPRCPGDFLSPSRHAFYPRPSPVVGEFAQQHRDALIKGSLDFVIKHRQSSAGLGTIAAEMFKQTPDNDVLARNLVGTLIGAIPPMDGNLRGILLEWLTERTLWRIQAALRAALDDRPASANVEAALKILCGPVSQAMCKRPAPDLLYRTALKTTTLRAGDGYPHKTYDPSLNVTAEERDLVILSLVSAAQHSLTNHQTPDGDVSIVFGGKRRKAYQPETNDIRHPVHACPARQLAMGAIMGILAALLDAGRIQALPASLIVRISDWV